MKIGVVSDLTGGADICVPVADLSTLSCLSYLAEGETVLFALSSPKEEYAFTNEALVAVCGGSAASTKRSVLRFEYQEKPVRDVRFETCGVTDRDCELKFCMGPKDFSVDIAKAEQPVAQRYYRVLLALARAQQQNAHQWEFAKQALDAAVRSTTTTTVSANAGTEPSPLVAQANAVHAWYVEVFERTNPRCYRTVIEAALANSVAAAPQ